MSQQLFPASASVSPSVVYIYDLVERRNVYTNHFAEQVLGHSSADDQATVNPIGLHLFHPEEIDSLNARYDSIRESAAEQADNQSEQVADESVDQNLAGDRNIFEIEYRLRDANGQWRWFYGRERVFSRSADGRPQQIIGGAVDISDRKAEIALQLSEHRYQQLYKNTPVMMHSIDSTGAIISVSDFWLKTMGYESSEVIGRSPIDFLTPASRQRAEDLTIPGYFKMGTCTEVPYQMVKKDGTLIDVLLSATVERDSSGAFLRSLAVLTNMTERKQTEAKLNRYQAHLEEMVVARTEELQQANERLSREVRDRQRAQSQLAQRAEALERSNADLEQFAYVISHDLQEPLRAMTVFSQLLSQRYSHQLDNTASGYINHVVEGGIRMQALIDGILAFSRVTYSSRSFELIDLQEALETALQNLQTAIDENQAEVTYDRLPRLIVDSSQIAQLFQNLIGNAIKFRSAAPPRIHIFSEQQAHHWVLSIKDNGIGIPAEQQSRIFDLFQRLHAHPDKEGYGIGLAICKKIVQRHGGSLSVASALEQGTTFSFTLPLKRASD